MPVVQVKNSQEKRTIDEPGDPLSNCMDMPKPWASIAVGDAADLDLCVVDPGGISCWLFPHSLFLAVTWHKAQVLS